MCENCHLSICSSRCPNAPSPREIYTCTCCNEGIFSGEEVVRLDCSYYHRDCFMDNAADILLKDFGAEILTATAEED